jgi:hypothetical protein
MAARTRSRATPKYRTRYRVHNWAAYEGALRQQRGDVTVWLDREASGVWNAPPSGRPGGQRRYSDLAILSSLTLRAVCHLALRQTEGFVGSVIRTPVRGEPKLTCGSRKPHPLTEQQMSVYVSDAEGAAPEATGALPVGRPARSHPNVLGACVNGHALAAWSNGTPSVATRSNGSGRATWAEQRWVWGGPGGAKGGSVADGCDSGHS